MSARRRISRPSPPLVGLPDCERWRGRFFEADDPLVLVDQKIEELGYAGDRNPVVLV